MKNVAKTALGLAIVLIGACTPGPSGPGGANPPTSGSKSVSISNAKAGQGKRFSPDTLDVASGETVVWKNNDEQGHDITSATGAFKSGNLDPGQSYTYKFTAPGTYKYICSFHNEEEGTVTVR